MPLPPPRPTLFSGQKDKGFVISTAVFFNYFFFIQYHPTQLIIRNVHVKATDYSKILKSHAVFMCQQEWKTLDGLQQGGGAVGKICTDAALPQCCQGKCWQVQSQTQVFIAVNPFWEWTLVQSLWTCISLMQARVFCFLLVAVAFWIPTSTCGSGRKKQCCTKFTCVTSELASNKIS